MSDSSESQWDDPVRGGEAAGGRVSEVWEGHVELLPLQFPLDDWWSSLWSTIAPPSTPVVEEEWTGLSDLQA